MKMSGVLSQGICFLLSILPEGNYEIGDDVTDIMGITQYEPTMDKEEVNDTENEKIVKKYPKFLMRWAWFRKLVLPKKQSKGFPSFISKTDETRIQNAPFYLEMDCNYVATEKVDGQSGSFTLQRVKGKHFGIKILMILLYVQEILENGRKTHLHFGVWQKNIILNRFYISSLVIMNGLRFRASV